MHVWDGVRVSLVGGIIASGSSGVRWSTSCLNVVLTCRNRFVQRYPKAPSLLGDRQQELVQRSCQTQSASSRQERLLIDG